MDIKSLIPTIQDVTVEIEESGYRAGTLGAHAVEPWKRQYSLETLPERLKCENPDCKGRGVSMFEALLKMAENRKTKESLLEPCGGNHKKTGRGKTCPNMFRVSVTISYHG